VKHFKTLKLNVAACLIWLTGSLPLLAQQDYESPPGEVSSSGPTPSTSKAEEDDDNIIRGPKIEETPAPREYSRAETQKVCNKYKDKLISVYGEIYKLKNCVRHLIHDQDDVYQMTRKGSRVVEVESSDVAALPIGPSWEDVTMRVRPCSAFNKKYITFSFTDIYYVENCIKRLVPDYETLIQHRRSRGQKNGEVLALNAKEFWSMRQGRDISSIVDGEFAKLLEGSADVDIIPIDEACRGVEGKLVSFYSKLYKIEKCRKREIDAEAFTMNRKLGEKKLIELKPEQWVSIPDGKPLSVK
jgi:hypothetical protein